MIRVKGLTKYYGDFLALDHLDLDIADGEIFAFLGPNGAGKTTTVKLLSGLLAPASGVIEIAGFDLGQNTLKAKKHIGLVPDEPYLYPKLKAWEFLELVAGIYQLDSDWVKSAGRYLELFELEHVLRDQTFIESFSHGMKQKVVFTSVLMRSPKVLLLDEPLVGLDPKAIRIVKSLLKEEAARGTTIFLSTHVLSIAEELASRIGIVQNGKLIFVGRQDELKDCLKEDKSLSTGAETLEDLFLELTAN